jgi:hypothetical protein
MEGKILVSWIKGNKVLTKVGLLVIEKSESDSWESVYDFIEKELPNVKQYTISKILMTVDGDEVSYEKGVNEER